MRTASHGRSVCGAARVLAGILAGAVAAGSTTVAAAQPASPPIASADEPRSATGADLILYLQASERAHQAAALDRASREPIGTVIAWNDDDTHASGRIVALSEFAGFGGAPCRDYRVVVEVPQRNLMVWTSRYNTYNNSAVPRQMAEPLSPRFVREFVTNACGAPIGLAAATPR
jgi:hypothetical protein